jgi:hypothetical protein
LPDILGSAKQRAAFESELAACIEQHPRSMNAVPMQAYVLETVG